MTSYLRYLRREPQRADISKPLVELNEANHNVITSQQTIINALLYARNGSESAWIFTSQWSRVTFRLKSGGRKSPDGIHK